MIELLRAAVAADADGAAVVTDEGTTTYRELLGSAESIAVGLRNRGIRRAALLDHDAVAVLAVLAGASLVGTEICQYPPTDDADQIRTLADRFDHAVLITRRAGPADLAVLSPEQLHEPGSIPQAPPGQRPLLVLTTGTTGAPRGARHDWNRVLRAAERIRPGTGQRWLLAYGLHQFAGLQILVHVLAARATLVAPAPRRPREGLAAMRRHGVTHASATPTYWRFLLAELRADGGPVPNLRQITLGGEAIPPTVLDALTATFPEAGISQVYAASEFGSSSSMRDGRHGLSLEVLERDDTADIAMKIVDGELWVRSRVGMLGYYGEEPLDADGWRPSGDLVDVVGDRILFRGRTSEVINVGGVKVHPLPVEERVGAVGGVDMARVYGRPNALTGSIVALEVVPAPGVDTDQLAADIRAACADLPPAARPRSIRFVDSVAMAGNKIVRRTDA